MLVLVRAPCGDKLHNSLRKTTVTSHNFIKVGFFEVVTPLGGARVFICASESCFGSGGIEIWNHQRTKARANTKARAGLKCTRGPLNLVRSKSSAFEQLLGYPPQQFFVIYFK